MDKRRPKSAKKGTYPLLMGDVTDPSAMDVHSIPNATEPWHGGQFAIPGTIGSGMTGEA
jgi:hypothetical protein